MGARVDRTSDPAILANLLLARRGTAYFLRKLRELPDGEFGGDSLLAGWTRSHVIAHVGYNARALSRLVNWAATGVQTPMYASPADRDHEIEFGATLSPNALRNLAEHSAVHLNVEWRDLAPSRWSQQVRTIRGRAVPATETAWMRAREVWLHAIDLDNGGRFEELPEEFLRRLLDDVTASWAARDVPSFSLRTGTETYDVRPADHPIPVTGTLPVLAAWATGRRQRDVTAPRWL
ncbi:maleylpyruvate isomerase family mycothiol-dependent enzyme [Acrocarpospora sp. B8E8]|uniref:maleylpyruvate isomerase family mycothiol-dependent enzyme n=1 Tax=Acrocarpospora sp. B8E8 TaxID=3153572 RepID=UPI00325DE755